MTGVEQSSLYRPLGDQIFTQSWQRLGKGEIQTGCQLEGRDFFGGILEVGEVYFGVIPGTVETLELPTAVFVTQDELGRRPKTIFQAEVEKTTGGVISRTKIDCSLGRPLIYDKQDVPPKVGYCHPLTKEVVPGEDLWVVLYDVWEVDQDWRPVKRTGIIRQVTSFPKIDSGTEGFWGNKEILEESVFEEQTRRGKRKPVIWAEKTRRLFIDDREYLYQRGGDGGLRLPEEVDVPEGIPRKIGRARLFAFYDSLSKNLAG